jgi:hypothetical protein
MNDIFQDMKVDVPEGEHNGVKIMKFEVPDNGDDLENFRLHLSGRGVKPGAYTKIIKDKTLWMSDTTAERRDHFGPAMEIRSRGGRILIGGLGLGMIVNVALKSDRVEHVDVVDMDPDIMFLVSPHYKKVAEAQGKTIKFYLNDIRTMKWPVGTRWNVAWFDIWPTISDEWRPEMTKLNRSYGQRCGWVKCWGQDLVDHMERQWKRDKARMGWCS